MISVTLEVEIYNHGEFIQRWYCARTTMPDGTPGVVWRGAPYRLEAGSRIDVGEKLPGTDPVRPVSIIPGEDATWVLVRGLAADMAAVQALITRNGGQVVRAGRWLGETDEAGAFDWYIRCAGQLPAEALAAVAAESSPADQPDDRQRIAVLETRLAELQASLAKPAASLPEAPPTDSQHISQIEALQAELAGVQTEAARIVRPPPATGAIRLQRELALVLKLLRPDLLLLRDSLSHAALEFPSREGVWRALSELPGEGSRPDGWKALRGAVRWWERHVSTGTDDTGRIYARFDRDMRKWQVLLGWKADQSRDISWLERLN